MAAPATEIPRTREAAFDNAKTADQKAAQRGQTPIVCPVCGGVNPADAVFCGNPDCRKALGEFKYVLEELQTEAQWHEVIADKVNVFIAQPHFVTAHFLWFGLWIAINTGILAAVSAFDEYPFGLLSIIVALEATFITIFVLISNNRQTTHAEKRAELDYEVNVRTYREIHEIRALFATMNARLDRLEATVHGRRDATDHRRSQ